MSWFFGNQTKKGGPGQTNLEVQKSKQIESLNRLNSVGINSANKHSTALVTEVLRDIEYRITFPVNNVYFTLKVLLPPQFPQIKPSVSMEPPARHPWVDNQMQVTLCPALLGFSMHSNLGSAIQSIIDEFRATPPQLVTQPPTHVPHVPYSVKPGFVPVTIYPPTSGLNLVKSTCATSIDHSLSTSDPRTPFFYQMPLLPSSYPQFTNMTISQLTTLHEDEEALNKFLEALPEAKKLVDDKEAVTQKCTKLAQNNLSMKPQLESFKQELRSGITTLGGQQSSLDAKRVSYSQLTSQYEPSHILTNLKVSILEAEEESENIADTFLNNKIVSDDFCKKFVEKRTLCHSRRAKEEKLQQIMLQQGHRF